MDKIGVLLVVGHHRILSDIVRHALVADPSIELVGDISEGEDTAQAVARYGCDAVVWLIADSDRAVAPAQLLSYHPRLRILAVEGDGRQAAVWRMRPERAVLGSLSPAGIVAELHGRS